jgi:hypothetical protein
MRVDIDGMSLAPAKGLVVDLQNIGFEESGRDERLAIAGK